MRLPDLRTSPEGRSASNAPKRIVRFPLFTVTFPFIGKSSIFDHLFYRRGGSELLCRIQPETRVSARLQCVS